MALAAGKQLNPMGLRVQLCGDCMQSEIALRTILIYLLFMLAGKYLYAYTQHNEVLTFCHITNDTHLLL